MSDPPFFLCVLYGVTINCTGQHWTTPGRYQARNDSLFRFDNELNSVRRANYPQLTTGMNSSQRSWWPASKLAWTHLMFPAYSVETKAPGVQGKCCHTRAKYISTSKTLQSITGPVWSSVVRCG